MHVFTEENTLLSSYSDASMPPTKIDIPRRTEPDEVEPAEAAVAPTNSSCQGPKVDSWALPMRPCHLPVTTAHSDADNNSHLLWVLEISSITCENGAFTVATNVRLQEATLITTGGDRVEVVALVDDRASCNVMDVRYFDGIMELLGELEEGEDLVGAGGNRLPTFGA